jgi:adenosylcobinamide-GDP ribazoletransferase
MNFIRHYLIALQFFTRIPITGKLANWVGYSPAMLKASAAHFPGIGWIIGSISAAVFYFSFQALPQGASSSAWVAIFLSTVVSVMLTGAFHEDGLADLADGLGGHVSRERSLDIMKDSRIGTYGSVALILGFLGKFSLLSLCTQMDPWLTCIALFGAHVSSRFMPLFLIYTLPHVGDTAQSKSKPLADSIAVSSLLIALIWWSLAMAAVVCLVPKMMLWLAALAACVIAAIWMRQFLQRRLQGFTGDGLGATQQVCELAFYLGLVFALG